jgi:hypothetical protein
MMMEGRLRHRLMQAIVQYGASCQLLSEAKSDEDRREAEYQVELRRGQIRALLDVVFEMHV